MSTKKHSGNIKPEDAIKNLEAKFDGAMKAFEVRFDNAQSSHTVTQLAADFQSFKETICVALEALKAQISSLTQLTDDMDNRSRCKFLLFRGVQEREKENLEQVVIDTAISNLKVSGFDGSDIQSCFRIGSAVKKDKPRPILVRFANSKVRAEVWRSKKNLKGCSISLAEFLTARRRELFIEARRIVGMSRCWTQDGNVIMKTKDGSKVRLTSFAQLKEIPETEEPSSKPKSRPVRNTKK